MKRVNWFSGQQVQQEDLAYLQESLSGEISSRTASQYSKGVISPVGSYVAVDENQTLMIKPFRAYTESGEQIVIPEKIRQLALDLTDDSNRQLGTQGFLEDEYFGWRENTPYIIVARYMEEGARPRPHYRTREPFPTRVYGGFKFFAMRENIDSMEENGINPYIVLATAIYRDGILTVETTGVTEYAGLDATRVSTTVKTNINGVYDLEAPISVDEHIRSIGDPDSVSAKNPHGITAAILGLDANAVPGHEKLFHSNGFIGDPVDVTSCFYTSIDSRSIGVDYLCVRNLNTGDNLHYNGSTITSFSYPTTNNKVYFAFTDDDGVWPDGTYSLYANLETREIVVATSVTQVLEHRSYKLIYRVGETDVVTICRPVNSGTINTNINYKLYEFTFKEIKEYTDIDLQGLGLNLSNFVKRVDCRKFGSVSTSNLQRNADGDLVLTFPIKTTAVKFSSDNSILTSANAYPTGYIDNSLRILYNDGTTIRVGTGSCKDSTNTKLLTLHNETVKRFFDDWSYGTNNGGLGPNVEKREGTYHVFIIGKDDDTTDIAIDTDINAGNCVTANRSLSSPIPDYRYYRRIGSLYVFEVEVPGSSSQLRLKQFITFPDSSNGVTTLYTDNVGGIALVGEDTRLPIPLIYGGGASPKYSYMTAKLNVTSASDVTYQEYLPYTRISAPTDGSGNQIPIPIAHKLSVGNNDIMSYNGRVKMSSTDWQGYVISYFDPRII